MNVCRAALTTTAVLSLTVVSCVPWTVRPLDDSKGGSLSGAESLNPAAYVGSLWNSRLLPAILRDAVDARTLLDALNVSAESARARYGHTNGSGSFYFIVKGTGRVLAVDAGSRSRSILIDVAPFDQRPDVWIQAGPILRGTSVRDATGIILFNDFLNQLQYADAGIELNNRVLKTVIDPVDVPSLKGRTLSFTGTAPSEEAPGAAIHDLVPVELFVEGRP